MADNASRPRPEGSPASDSSTCTLKGDEATEGIQVLVKEPSVGDITKDASVRRGAFLEGIEVIDGRKKKPVEMESKISEGRKTKTTDKETGGLGRKGSLQAKLRTLDRGFSATELGPPSAAERNTLLGTARASTLTRSSSNQGASNDITSLNPKTLESLEKYKKLKVRTKTPEPVSSEVPEAKLQLSPERSHRRKSVGMHPIERRIDVKRFGDKHPTVEEELHISSEVRPEEIQEPKVMLRASPSPTKMSSSPASTRGVLSPSPTKMTASSRQTFSPSPTRLRREEESVWRHPRADEEAKPQRSQIGSKDEDLSPELTRKRASPSLYMSDRRSSGSSTSSVTSIEVARILERKDKGSPTDETAKPLGTEPSDGRRSRESRLRETGENGRSVSPRISPDLKREELKAEVRGYGARSTSPRLRSATELPLRQKSPIPDRLKVTKMNRRKTPVISTDALDAILSGDIPFEELEQAEDDEAVLGEKFLSQRKAALEACPEEDESQKSPERTRRNMPLPDVATHVIRSSSPGSRQTVVMVGADIDRSRSPEKRVEVRVPSDNHNRSFTESLPAYTTTERRANRKLETGRVSGTSGLSPEKTLSPPTSPGFDPLNCSMGSKTMPSRLRVQSMSLSRSTPDLTEIGGNVVDKDRKGKRVERSNSRRLKNRFTRLGGGDSYITDTSIHHSSHTSAGYRSGRSTLPTKLLSGSSISQALSRKHRDRDSSRSNRLRGSDGDWK